jgi:alcohol dehydrogenase class IV
MMALEGIRALSQSLPTIVTDPTNLVAREKALYGAWLCSICAGTVGVALHHKLCHTLGGSCGLPHAETHTVVLPHAIAYNAPAVPDAMQRLAEALEGSEGDAIRGLNLLLDRLGVKRSLKDLGMKEGDIDKAAGIAMERQYWNPRAVEKDGIREVLRRCWAGEDARADL